MNKFHKNMEFNEYLKSRFPEYYKKKSEGFGLKLQPEEREKRAKKQNLERKHIRSRALLERRKIQEISMEETKPELEVKKSSRKSLLRIWKQEKQIKLEAEKLKKKPVFKIPSAANVGFPELKAIYPNGKSVAPKNFKFKPPKNIKPIYFMNNVEIENKNSVKPEVIKRVTRSQKPQASPPLPLPIRKTRKVLTEDGVNSRKHDSSSNQSTKNIKKSGSQAITSATKKDVSETVKENGENVEKILSVLVTPLEMLENKNKAVVKTPSSTRRRSLRNKPVEEPKLNETFDLSSSQTGDINKNDSLKNKSFDSQKTPENLTPVNTRRSLVYISPFVSTSRGKGSVKKENKEREVRGLPSYTKHNTPDEESNRIIQTVGAQYFHNALENEISRLLVLCDTWNLYKETEDLPEEAKDLIDVATGQAHLLMNKKFQQFRGLINACQSGESEQVVTCEDLQGFWDMVYIQVENLNVRFNKLSEMKNNNWEEVIPEIKRKVTKKRAPAKTTKAKASSNLRAAIQAARKKTQNQAEENQEKNTLSVFDGGFFTVKSPTKNTVNSDINTAASTPDIGRRSLRISVVTSEARKTLSTSKNSPALALMRVSQCAKDLEKSNCSSEYVGPTPGKSILKSAHKSSENRRLTRTSKVVLFKDDTEE